MSPWLMHDVKNKVNDIKRENISLEIEAEFFMSQMIEENRKKVYWKMKLKLHISALLNQILSGGREDKVDYLFDRRIILVL